MPLIGTCIFAASLGAQCWVWYGDLNIVCSAAMQKICNTSGCASQNHLRESGIQLPLKSMGVGLLPIASQFCMASAYITVQQGSRDRSTCAKGGAEMRLLHLPLFRPIGLCFLHSQGSATGPAAAAVCHSSSHGAAMLPPHGRGQRIPSLLPPDSTLHLPLKVPVPFQTTRAKCGREPLYANKFGPLYVMYFTGHIQ